MRCAPFPPVVRHELDLPRIALVHSWLSTQNEGWVRYAFDVFGIPYTYLSVQQLQNRALLEPLRCPRAPLHHG